MFELDRLVLQTNKTTNGSKRLKLSESAQSFMDNTGHDIIHLFNDVLLEKDDLISVLIQNDIINLSSKLPGLIIQAYLVLVEIFNLDVMEPLKRVKEEVELLDTRILFDEVPEASDEITIENVLQQTSGKVKLSNFMSLDYQTLLFTEGTNSSFFD